MSDYFVNRPLMTDDYEDADSVYASINGDKNVQLVRVDKSSLWRGNITNWCFDLVIKNDSGSAFLYSHYLLPELPKEKPAGIKAWRYTIRIGDIMKKSIEREIKDYESSFLLSDIKADDVM